MRKTTAVVMLVALLQAAVPVAARAAADPGTSRKQAQQPLYDLRVSSEKLAFRVYVNDLPISVLPTKRIGTIGMPLNPAILRSGPQKLTIRLLPATGQQRLPDTDDLKVELVVRSKTEPPRNTTLYELPPLRDGRQALFTDPQGFSQTVQFEAQVPYSLAGWERSVPLDAADPKLEAEALEVYRRLIADIGNRKGEAFMGALAKAQRLLYPAIYLSSAEARERDAEWVSFIDKGTGTVAPLEHHALEIHGDGKLVRLKRTDPASVDEGVVRIAYKRGPQPRTIVYDIYLHRPAPGAKLEPIWYFMTDFN
ncbi:hypothetical protein [Variovorax sp.]|jgi:hypothetical protein|uniref:hypothetical protein n=1 Tax=Variovorax sp. TaxID=1871043 RepID=UPI0025DD44F4|nr:hypothetical protein [Variovorax sp.]